MLWAATKGAAQVTYTVCLTNNQGYVQKDDIAHPGLDPEYLAHIASLRTDTSLASRLGQPVSFRFAFTDYGSSELVNVTVQEQDVKAAIWNGSAFQDQTVRCDTAAGGITASYQRMEQLRNLSSSIFSTTVMEDEVVMVTRRDAAVTRAQTTPWQDITLLFYMPWMSWVDLLVMTIITPLVLAGLELYCVQRKRDAPEPAEAEAADAVVRLEVRTPHHPKTEGPGALIGWGPSFTALAVCWYNAFGLLLLKNPLKLRHITGASKLWLLFYRFLCGVFVLTLTANMTASKVKELFVVDKRKLNNENFRVHTIYADQMEQNWGINTHNKVLPYNSSSFKQVLTDIKDGRIFGYLLDRNVVLPHLRQETTCTLVVPAWSDGRPLEPFQLAYVFSPSLNKTFVDALNLELARLKENRQEKLDFLKQFYLDHSDLQAKCTTAQQGDYMLAIWWCFIGAMAVVLLTAAFGIWWHRTDRGTRLTGWMDFKGLKKLCKVARRVQGFPVKPMPNAAHAEDQDQPAEDQQHADPELVHECYAHGCKAVLVTLVWLVFTIGPLLMLILAAFSGRWDRSEMELRNVEL